MGKKLCLVSSSGGHYEQLQRLKELEEEYDVIWVTEKTAYEIKAQYYLVQTGLRDRFYIMKMIYNFFYSLYIWIREQPDYVVTTGAMVAIPMAIIAKIFGKKIIFIETFARVYDGTKTGRLIYKYADLFIIQWESLQELYPNAIFGGSIY